MRRWAPGPRWTGAIAGVALLALAAAAGPASGAPQPARAEPAAKRKPKPRPKPVTCRPAQTTTVLRGRRRCVSAPRTGADERLALARAVLGGDTGTLRARGRRIRPIWKAGGGRLARVRARLLRALPRALAFADRVARASARVPGDPPGCAADPRGDRRASFDGFGVSVGADGDVSMTADAAGYRIEALLGGLHDCADLDLPECPMPDGRLDGTDGRRRELGLRITREGRLVQSLSTTVRSRQTLRARVADDAKLDELDLTDVTSDTLTFQVPGRTVVVRVGLRGTARLNLRSGAITGAQVQASVGFSGTTPADALGAAGRTTDEYAQRFPALVRAEGEHPRRRERLWQAPGRCAKLAFEPPTDALTLEQDEAGQVTARIEARAGGVAAKARWTVSGPENGTVTPASLDGPGSAPFAYRVTRAGRGLKLRATFRATSTAGVAEDPWSQPTRPPPEAAFFAIDEIVYSASYTGTTSGSGVPCTATNTNTETATAGPLPFDPTFAALQPLGDGGYGGAIAPASPEPATRTGTASGCDISQDPPPPACVQPINVQVPLTIGLIVQIPPEGDASVTWALPPATAGDGGPAVPCYTPTIVATPEPPKQTVPRSTFLDPGPHALTVNAGASFSQDLPGFSQSLSGSASATLRFHRVNADGTPYTG